MSTEDFNKAIANRIISETKDEFFPLQALGKERIKLML
jgi:hypothetical protein